MRKIQLWFNQRGFKSILLLVGVLAPLFLLGFTFLSGLVTGGCALLFIYINWQTILDSSELDEKAVIIYQKVKIDVEREYHDTKTELENKIEELERKIKDYINEKVKPFKD